MSDLSIRTAPDVAVNPPRKAAVEVKSSDVSAQASSQKSSVDVSNYVTSPKGVVDPQSGVYVLQFRDGETGEVLNQYPSEKVVAAYKSAASNSGGGSVQLAESASSSSTSALTSTGSAVGSSAGAAGTVSVSTGPGVSVPEAPAPLAGSSVTAPASGTSVKS